MAERVAVIDYGSGNLRSVEKALIRVAREKDLDAGIAITGDPDRVRHADRVVLPGVGAFADCMKGLFAISGMVDAIKEAARTKPLLGICVGMQLLADMGEEHGPTKGFGLIGGRVVPILPDDPALKVPHMGWNALELLPAGRGHALMSGVETGDHVYFVHSYRFVPAHEDDVLAEVTHGGPIVAAIARDMVAGFQFHPEKSQASGLRLLGNFLAWRP